MTIHALEIMPDQTAVRKYSKGRKGSRCDGLINFGSIPTETKNASWKSCWRRIGACTTLALGRGNRSTKKTRFRFLTVSSRRGSRISERCIRGSPS
jgi:hypothetical protein